MSSLSDTVIHGIHGVDQERDYPPLVEFDGPDDPQLALNWTLAWKIWVTLVVAILNLIGTVASSIFGTGNEKFMQEFNISHEVAVLGTTLFLAVSFHGPSMHHHHHLLMSFNSTDNRPQGYIFGFLAFGPLSERFGRKWPMLLGIIISSLFDLMTALGHNVPTILIGRFFGGLFGVAPVAIFGGVISDCWSMAHRGIAMALAVSLVFSGPTFGPVFGGFIMASSTLDWRWNMWVVVIVGLGASLLCVCVFPETYAPAILRKKARALRRKTGNLAIKTASEKEGLGLQHILRVYLIRPFCSLGSPSPHFTTTLSEQGLANAHHSQLRAFYHTAHPGSSDIVSVIRVWSTLPVLPNLPFCIWRRPRLVYRSKIPPSNGNYLRCICRGNRHHHPQPTLFPSPLPRSRWLVYPREPSTPDDCGRHHGARRHVLVCLDSHTGHSMAQSCLCQFPDRLGYVFAVHSGIQLYCR